ncbi:MAG: class I SAM-dependent DNA methyltransferase, partial [Candidatus Omnitrophica bacterium]|nr:class I SAM-dependent DNA methyltransferase [Candidatus Omnitrophota bacterium]
MPEERNSGREILDDIIKNFSPDKFTRFFREKSRSFTLRQEAFTLYNDEYFSDGVKLGEIKFSESEKLVVCAFKANRPLSERSGKKAQYDKGKEILKDTQSDAGIFIFYDKDGNFRFSLIYPKAIGNRRQWSNFRRFTYFVSREFTNKTFLQRIGASDFSSFQKIKDAFSVEKVTKEFYEDIANWYFWAVQHSTFPKDAEEEENGRNIAVIRLITRMIFIWFMREQGLVPKNLFEEKSISEMLKEISSESSTYYQAILQNLFFATLSTKKDDRKFRSEIRGYKGYNPDFGNQNVFRFQELFKNPENLKDDFGEIPFLNGGLFECLDDKPNGIYIDGFTSVKKNQPTVPNILFFSGEQKADLNTAYGTKSKTYKVRGLLDILSSFNFTIDENSPDDSDIALDPELLGRVFENLLASFNPETSTTARKATGSYYTPREIVDYMVAESLKAYFKTHLSPREMTQSISRGEAISDPVSLYGTSLDKKIDSLFSTGSEENIFNKSESKKIVELIESVRIVDPAVGSGAFPMGALNKLVFILNKVDPANELWKQAQISAADTIPDPCIKQDTKNRIEEFFKGKNADYGRKLYLIQKCIYGVDIQQIAVEIAKLRFFISLLVDEKLDKTKENWGIEPLPNLDFKIMQGNSLISEFLGIDFDNGQEKKDAQGQVRLWLENEDGSLIKEFERKKIDYQNESDKDKKAKLKNEVEDLMIK